MNTNGFKDTPEKNPAEFYRYVSGLDWETDPNAIVDQNFECHGKCPGSPNDSVRLEFVPAKTSPNHNWVEALKGESTYSGEVVVKLTNKSDWNYEPLKLPARTTAYLWVGENKFLKPKEPVLYASTMTEARRLKRAKFHFCSYPSVPEQPPKVAMHGKFGDCPETNAHSQGVGVTPPDNPIWVSCGGGCCQNQF